MRRPKHPYLRYRTYDRKVGKQDIKKVDMTGLWSPQTTRRVRRLSDGRVFSSSLGAAIYYNHKYKTAVWTIARAIEQVCDKQAIFVYIADKQTHQFEWADDYEDNIDLGDLDDYIERVEEGLALKLEESVVLNLTNEHIAHILHRSYALFNSFKQVRAILNFLESGFAENLAEPIRFKYFYEIFDTETKKYSAKPIMDMRSLARHMNIISKVYRDVYGLIIEKVKCAELNGQKVLHISYDESLINEKLTDLKYENERVKLLTVEHNGKIYPRTLLKFNRMFRSKSIPVYVHHLDTTYHSISQAAEVHLASKQIIAACCFGDIDSYKVPGSNVEMEFSYGKFDDLDEMLDVNSTLEGYHSGKIGSNSPIAVYEVTKGRTFSSISEASRVLHIPPRFVRYSLDNSAEVSYVNERYQVDGEEMVSDNYRFVRVDSDEFDKIMMEGFAKVDT